MLHPVDVTFLSYGLRPLPPAPFGFSGLPFGSLGRSLLTFWEPFWHLGSTLGSHFSVSGALWEAILAPRNHPGGPWEKQDGREVANNRIFVDLGVILELVYGSFWEPTCFKTCCFVWLGSESFFIDFCFDISMSCLSNRGVRIQGIAKINCSWTSCLVKFGMGV